MITKHPGTGGAVTVETVTAQLLYEVGGPAYLGPDVVTRLDTVTLTADGPDRVRVSGVRGTPPPDTLKVGVNNLGGFRNSMTFVLCGLDIEAKAALVRGQLEEAVGKEGLEFTPGPHRPPGRRRHRGGERAAARTPARRRPDAGRAGLLGGRGGAGAGLLPGLHADHPARRRHARTACSPPTSCRRTRSPHVAVLPGGDAGADRPADRAPRSPGPPCTTPRPSRPGAPSLAGDPAGAARRAGRGPLRRQGR